MTIRRFRRFTLVAALILAVAFVLDALLGLHIHNLNAWTVNVAGRLRMFVHEMRVEALAVQAGNDSLHRDTLEQVAHAAFEPALHALRHGGTVSSAAGQTVELLPPFSAEVAFQLTRVEEVWVVTHDALHALLVAEPGSAEQAAAGAAFDQHARALLAVTDETVSLVLADSARRSQWLYLSQVVLLAANLGLIIYIVRASRRRITTPLENLSEATRRISRGDFSRPVRATGVAEISVLGHELEEMRQRLNRSAGVQNALLAFSQALLSAASERAIAEKSVAVAAELLQTEFSTLVLPDARGRLIIRAVRGWSEAIVGTLEVQPGTGSQTGFTVQQGLPVAVEDYSAPQPFEVPALIRDHGIASGLSVPMVVEGQVVGAMLVHSRQRRVFGDEPAGLLALIANQTAVALSKIRLLAAERQRADELEALRATTADTLRVAEFDLGYLLQMILERAVTLLDATGGDLGMCSEDGSMLHIVSSHNMGRDYTGTRMVMGEGVMGRAAATRHPMIVPDYAAWEGRSPQYEGGAWHAVMAAPLLVGERLVGAIGIVTINPDRHFTESSLHLLTLFAQQAALAIEQARLFAAERQRVREAETLRQAGAIVASTLREQEAIELILQQLEAVIPYDSGSVQLLHDGYLEVVGGRGWPDPAGVVGFRFPVPGDNPNTVVVEQRRAHILDDAPSAYENFRRQPHDHIRSWLGVPLIVHDRLIGMVAIDSTVPAYFTPEHARLASAFADQVAIVIENARLYQAAVRAAETRAILHEVGREISASLDPEQVYTAIQHAAAKLMPTEAFIIALLNEARKEIEVVYMVDRGTRVRPPPLPSNESLSGYIVATGRSVLVRDAENLVDSELAGLRLTHAGHTEHVHSVLAVPLRMGEKVLGMLSAQSYRANAYSIDDQHLLELLAVNAAIALSNARFFEQVQHLAITDALTGLHNRRHFYDLAEREFKRVRRYGRTLAVIMADIDHFKKVNDAHGHAVGDEVLREVAGRCRDNLRSVDILGRYGGEEFVVLLPESDWAGTAAAAERLRRCVAVTPIPTARGPLPVTNSLGFALIRPGCSTLAELIDCADQALYLAKARGRNRVESLDSGDAPE